MQADFRALKTFWRAIRRDTVVVETARLALEPVRGDETPVLPPIEPDEQPTVRRPWRFVAAFPPPYC